MSNGSIFVSYRRDDSAGFTRAIYNELVEHFFQGRVFMDVEAIQPGLPFDEAIKAALDQCEVLLVMIGRRWLEPQAGGGSRLNDPNDFVHFEIEEALARKVRVIPVLLDGASMPNQEALPESIRPMALRHAIEVSNSRFEYDVGRLIEIVRKALGETLSSETSGREQERTDRKRVPYWLIGVIATIALSGVVVFYLWTRNRNRDPNICLQQYLAGIPEDRQKAIESSLNEVVIVSGEQQPKDGWLGIKFLEHNKPIGAARLTLFASGSDYPSFKDIKLYDANCQEIQDYSNKSRGGNKHEMINWDFLVMHLEGRTYELRLGYDEHNGTRKGQGDITALFFQDP